MNILKSANGITADEIYGLTKSTDVRRLKDAKGEILGVEKYVYYEEENSDGENVKVLAMVTDNDVKYATNSKTFIRDFFAILTIFSEEYKNSPICFIVGSRISNSGNEYLTCEKAYKA